MGCMAGWVNAVIRVTGGVFGILYLWLRSEIGQPREARPAVSQRILYYTVKYRDASNKVVATTPMQALATP